MSLTVEKQFALAGHTGSIYALEQGARPRQFFSGGSDRQLVNWNLDKPGEGESIAAIPGIIYALRFHPASNMLFAGQSQGGIHLLDLGTKREIKLLAFHRGPVFDLLVAEKQQLLVSAGGDGTIHFIDMTHFRSRAAIEAGPVKIRCLMLNPEQDKLLAGCQDGRILVINMNNLTLEHQWQAHQEGFSVNTMAILPGNRQFVSGGRDACINCYEEIPEFNLLRRIPAHHYAVYHLLVSPGQRFLASASRDKTIKIWDPVHLTVWKRLDASLAGHVNSVNRLIWSASDNLLISAGDDRIILGWKLDFQEK